MPSEKSLDNLKKGRRFTANADDVLTKRAQSNGGKATARKIAMRKQAQDILNAMPDVGENTLSQLRQLGMETDNPTLQTLILARIGAMAIGKDSRLALRATEMLLEITGNDVRTMIAKEDQKIQREKIALEREKINAGANVEADGSEANIYIMHDGGIEVDDGT